MKLGIIQLILGSIAFILHWVFGGWDKLLFYLLVFMVFDYMMGLIRAGLRKEISARISYRGLAKKVGILVIVAIANGLDQLFASQKANIFALDLPVIRTIVIWGYIINEIMSILKHIKHLGVPLPAVLEKVLSILKVENEKNVRKK